MKTPRTEAELQKWFIKELKIFGYITFKFASPARKGVPDLMLIDEFGKIDFVEMKHPNGKGRLSELQKVTIRKMKEQRCDVFICSSVEDCYSYLNGTLSEVPYASLQLIN